MLPHFYRLIYPFPQLTSSCGSDKGTVTDIAETNSIMAERSCFHFEQHKVQAERDDRVRELARS